MSEIINNVLEQLSVIFSSTDDVLREWNGEGNMQFPALLGMLAIKMDWDEKQVREADPLIRFYIRRNSDYHVTRGAHGGIMKSSDKQKKEAIKMAKDLAKKQMQILLEAKAATMTSDSVSSLFTSSEEELEDIFLDK